MGFLSAFLGLSSAYYCIEEKDRSYFSLVITDVYV